MTSNRSSKKRNGLEGRAGQLVTLDKSKIRHPLGTRGRIAFNINPQWSEGDLQTDGEQGISGKGERNKRKAVSDSDVPQGGSVSQQNRNEVLITESVEQQMQCPMPPKKGYLFGRYG